MFYSKTNIPIQKIKLQKNRECIIELTKLLTYNDRQIRRLISRNGLNYEQLIYLRSNIQQNLYLHGLVIRNIKNDLSTLSRG